MFAQKNVVYPKRCCKTKTRYARNLILFLSDLPQFQARLPVNFYKKPAAKTRKTRTSSVQLPV
jgi:hypothetical protein